MAQKTKVYAVSALKALTYRIASTPTAQLPRCASQLASAIWTSRDLLSTPADALKQDADLSVVVHRFKTQLSTLLQDRTVEGRWTAIVLVKAAIEAGGVEILSKSQTWVRNILGIIQRPDPPTTKCLAVLTLTRIFMLTWDYPNLVREITTPSLPTFVVGCYLEADEGCSNEHLQCILEAFETLIPHHPTIFRTNESNLRKFLLDVVSSSASVDSRRFSPQNIVSAQRLLVLLSFCAPKQGGGEKWNESLQNAVAAAHQTCDVVFSPVVEVWRSNVDAYQNHATARSTASQVEQDEIDRAGLKAWSGGFAGAERLMALLDLIAAHIQLASPAAVQVRIGMIWDLASRLLAVTVPGSKQRSVHTNAQMAATTRETLFTTLPSIQKHVLAMLESMFDRLGDAMLPTIPTVLESIASVFDSASFDVDFRSAAYSLVRTVIQQAGYSLNKDNVAGLSQIMLACCNELLPTPSALDTQASSQGTDLLLQTSKSGPSNPVVQRHVHLQASRLLPALLMKLDATKVSRKVRIQMDRTAVLTQHKDALLASVLNPPPSPSGVGLQSSLLPMLARLYPNEPEVEALVRPRMPLLVPDKSKSLDEEDQLSEIEEEALEAEAGTELPDTLSTRPGVNTNTDAPTQETSTPAKRVLSQGDSDIDSAKRPRHETASSQIQSEWNSALAADASHVRVDRAPTVTATISKLPSNASEAFATPASDDDGSDFEVPPLTMEQDTEDEDD